MDVVEKQIVHEYDENHKEYASKGVAGTGLGLGYRWNCSWTFSS